MSKKIGWAIAIIIVAAIVWWYAAGTSPSAPASNGTVPSATQPAVNSPVNSQEDSAALQSEVDALQDPDSAELDKLEADIEGNL